MNQRRNSMMMIVTILLVAFFYHFFNTGLSKEKEIIAEVEDEKIYFNDLVHFADKEDVVLTEKNRGFLLDNLIAQKVLLKYSEISGIQKNEIMPYYEKEKEFVKRRLIIDRFFELQSFNNTTVRNKEVKRYYKNNILYKIRVMNFEKKDQFTMELAQSAHKRLSEGDYFNEVYHFFFPDDEDKEPGLVGVTDLEDMSDALKNVISSLKRKGEFSSPIETKDFISIYYRDAYPTYSESKEYIFKKLYNKKKNEVKQAQYDAIMNSITINYYLIKQLIESKFILDSNKKYESLAVSNLTDTQMTAADFVNKVKEDYNIADITIYPEAEIQEFVKGLFLQDVVYDYALKINFDKSAGFVRELNIEYRILEEKMTEESLRLIVERLIGNVEPTIGEIQEEYYQSSDSYRRSVLFKIQEIVVKRKETALKVLELAKKGYDFDELVQVYSEDESKNYNNGKTGYLNEYDLKDDYKKMINYQPNDIMDLRETLDSKYIVTKIIDRQNGAMKNLALVRNEIISRIIYKKVAVKVEEIIDKYDLFVKKYPQRLIAKKVRKVRLLKGFN